MQESCFSARRTLVIFKKVENGVPVPGLCCKHAQVNAVMSRIFWNHDVHFFSAMAIPVFWTGMAIVISEINGELSDVNHRSRASADVEHAESDLALLLNEREIITFIIHNVVFAVIFPLIVN